MSRSGQAETSTVDAATVAAARAKVGRAARAIVDDVALLVRRADALLAARDELRELARRQLESLGTGDAGTQLRRRPIGDLKEFAGRGARLGRLQKAGIRTVADVLDARPHDLDRVPGVGPQTVRRVTAAARRLEAELVGATSVRLDPDRRDPAQTRLLATVAAIRAADAVPAALREDLAAFVAKATPSLAEAERTTSWFRMALSGKARRHAALLALIRLDGIRAERGVGELERAMIRHEPAVDPDSYRSDRLWRDYLVDAAPVNAVLANLRAERDADAARGFIPEELRQEITALPLDTTLVTSQLRRYQVFGAQYAIHQERSMLGDEMGLGKTVQALAVFAHLAARGQRRFLVVCPASVQVNWLNEIGRHTRLAAHSLHGADRDRAGRRWLREGGVAVTTFGTLGRLDRKVRTAEVAMLVVDEAHFVKNPNAERSRVVAKATRSAQRALFMTGTPMENRVDEFRALVRHLQPRVADRVDSIDALADARHFRRMVAPVYLRRNQDDVLDELPDKIEVEEWVQLSARDEVKYLAAVRSRNLMAMRRAAFASRRSAKLERLLEIVDEAEQDRMKVVVFSFFLDVLDTVARTLRRAVVGSITGAVAPGERQRLIDEFSRRDGHAVLLAQIEAGGVGLNVQAASVVIITEPQWKPATEDQAVARAHRMGQVRKVQVHHLLAKDSVDERIHEIQEGKRLLFDEYARKSDAKHVDVRAVDPSEHRPEELDDGSVPPATRVLLAEEHRLAARLRR
jgi:superfamily II DNA or RNA helicase